MVIADFHPSKMVCMLSLIQLFATPWRRSPWDFLGKDTEVGCHFSKCGDLYSTLVTTAMLDERQEALLFMG